MTHQTIDTVTRVDVLAVMDRQMDLHDLDNALCMAIDMAHEAIVKATGAKP